MGERNGNVSNVDWKHDVDYLSRQHAHCSVEECFYIGSAALHAGCILGDVVCPCCDAAYIE